MAFKVIIRRHEGVQSYLVLDDKPRELLRHVGFYEEFSIRTWYGSVTAEDAREEWAEMLGEDPYDGSYLIVDGDFRDYVADAPLWAHCLPDKG